MNLPNSLQAPFLLQELQWIVDPVSYMEKAARQHPDIFSAGIFNGQHLVFVNHPQAIQEILTSDRKRFIGVKVAKLPPAATQVLKRSRDIAFTPQFYF